MSNHIARSNTTQPRSDLTRALPTPGRRRRPLPHAWRRRPQVRAKRELDWYCWLMAQAAAFGRDRVASPTLLFAEILLDAFATQTPLQTIKA